MVKIKFRKQSAAIEDEETIMHYEGEDA